MKITRRAHALSTLANWPHDKPVPAEVLKQAMRKKQSRTQPEQALQIQICKLLKAANLLFWHTPSAGMRSPQYIARLYALGFRAGIPDILVYHAGRLYGLELKIGSNKTSDAQEQFMREMTEAGGVCWVVRSVEEAREVIRRIRS